MLKLDENALIWEIFKTFKENLKKILKFIKNLRKFLENSKTFCHVLKNFKQK